VRERERLIARIREIRRVSRTADDATDPRVVDPERDHLRALEARVEHLEALVQGLQDSVHRESSRHATRIAELEARIQPGALGKALRLSHDARARGL
jgi:BMFP domain-containing protein YqiC